MAGSNMHTDVPHSMLLRSISAPVSKQTSSGGSNHQTQAERSVRHAVSLHSRHTQSERMRLPKPKSSQCSLIRSNRLLHLQTCMPYAAERINTRGWPQLNGLVRTGPASTPRGQVNVLRPCAEALGLVNGLHAVQRSETTPPASSKMQAPLP